MNVCVIDDLDKNLRLYCDILTGNQFQVQTFNRPEEFLKQINQIQTDLILLDWNMPLMNGFEVLKSIRKARPQLPVVMITGEYFEKNLIDALEMGAEDFIIKPVSNAEMIARIKNKILKSKSNGRPRSHMSNGVIVFNDDNFTVSIKGNVIRLQNKEFKVFRYIVARENTIVTREEIMTSVWDAPEINSTTLDTHLSILRKKLGEFACALITKKGIGYLYDPTKLEEINSETNIA